MTEQSVPSLRLAFGRNGPGRYHSLILVTPARAQSIIWSQLSIETLSLPAPGAHSHTALLELRMARLVIALCPPRAGGLQPP
jgi:hypothetical protein